MSDIVVLAFDNETGAYDMQSAIKRLQKDRLLELDDAAIVVRKKDGKAKVTHASDLVGVGALGGAFWGMLIGLIFWMPFLGMAVGAASGAIVGKFADVPLKKKFIKEVTETVKPGNSALFLLVRKATPDKVLEELKGFKCKVLQTSLSKEADARLRETFGSA